MISIDLGPLTPPVSYVITSLVGKTLFKVMFNEGVIVVAVVVVGSSSSSEVGSSGTSSSSLSSRL